MQVLDQHTGDYLEPETVPRPLTILATAVAVGVGAEIALHTSIISSEPPGLGIPIAAAVIVAGLLHGAVRLGRTADGPTWTMYLAAIGFAALTAVRASPPLVAINVISSLTLLGLAATAHNPGSRRPVFASEFARAARKIVARTSFGGFLIVGRDLRNLELQGTEKLRRVAVGVFVAVPMLVVFGSLFMSADQVFGDAIGNLFNLQLPDTIVAAVGLAGLISWGMLGLLRGIVSQPASSPEPAERGSLGMTEAATAMWLVNGLFAVFVAFQIFEVAVSYGSRDVSYAQQARSGFFQLVWVAAIVVMVVLFLDWIVAARDQQRLHRLQSALVLLTGFVLISALVRMALYVDAFGLTRLRVFTTVFMFWIAFVLVWLTRSVLRGRRDRFARPAVAGLLAATLILNIVNPDGLIAGYNLEHRPRSAPGVDVSYLHQGLSPDAVPAIVANIDQIGDRCAQMRVVERLEAEQSSDIRNWNLSRSRAAGLIQTMRFELAAACRSG